MLNGLGTNTAALNTAASSVLIMASASFDVGAFTVIPEPNHVHLGSADIQSPTQAYFDIHGRMMAVMDLTVDGGFHGAPRKTGALQSGWQNGITFVAPLTEYLFGSINFSVSGDQLANASAIFAEAGGTVTSSLVGIPTRITSIVGDIDAAAIATFSGGEVILGSYVDMPLTSTWVTEPHIVTTPQVYDGSVNWSPFGEWSFDNDYITIIANGFSASVVGQLDVIATKTNAVQVESSATGTTFMGAERITQRSVDFGSTGASFGLEATKRTVGESTVHVQGTFLPGASLVHAVTSTTEVSGDLQADVLMAYGAVAQWDVGATISGFSGDRIRTQPLDLVIASSFTGEADVTKLYYFDFQAFGGLLTASAIVTLPDAPDERELVVEEQDRKLVVGATSRQLTA